MDMLKGRDRGVKSLEWAIWAETAFLHLKEVLCTYHVLHSLLSRSTFTVYTDASEMGLEATLAQQMPRARAPSSF